MTSVVLAYDRAIAPQETYYWCGPASTQMVLNSLGIFKQESDLARMMGTHTGGTDHIGLPARVLNELTGGGWEVRTMPHDPPTGAETDRLWSDIVDSINAGNGVVVNIVAPPNNYPRGANGSISPAYGGGVVYHYVAAMGYEDEGRGRFVWIADSGFRPFGYWITLEQLATLIPPKGYAYKPVGPVKLVPGRNMLHDIDRDMRLIHDQLTIHWPQLGGRTLKEALEALYGR